MENYKKLYPNNIKGYTFLTPEINSWPAITSPIRISTLSNFTGRRARVFGVSENYLKSTYTDFLIPEELDEEYDFQKLDKGLPDIVESLYSDKGNKLIYSKSDVNKAISNSDIK